MSRRISLEQWTDRALRECLKLFERSDVITITSAEQCVMRGQLRDLLKKRRSLRIRNTKLGLRND